MDLDSNIRGLVAVLNSFQGIRTSSSCGGHENPGACQAPAGSWYVTFELQLEDGRPSEDAWLSLEFLTWLVNHDGKGETARIVMDSPPPYLNGPGSSLYFDLTGSSDPDELGEWIQQARAQVGFIP